MKTKHEVTTGSADNQRTVSDETITNASAYVFHSIILNLLWAGAVYMAIYRVTEIFINK